MTTRRLLPLALVAVAVAAAVTASPFLPRAPVGVAEEKSAPVAAPATDPDLAKAIRGGVEYLVKSQKKDGSWGSPASNLYDIYAPGPGAHYAFRGGSSALALSALIEVGDRDPALRELAADAVRRGTDYMIAHADVRRSTVDALYNIWGNAYGVHALARAHAREQDEARRKQLRDAMGRGVGMLRKYQYAEGGWGYYDFDTHTQQPGLGATSFTTATVLVALKAAREQGVEFPDGVWKDALKFTEFLRKPDNAFAYSFDHRYWPQGPINKIKGSLARTPACLHAIDLWGGKVTEAHVVTALDNLEKEDRFLRIARKYPQPHESWYQNSGYFCFYGYYYASLMFPRVKDPARLAKAKAHFTKILAPLQEEDGSFWDYQLYGYHKAYGTGYVLLALNACR